MDSKYKHFTQEAVFQAEPEIVRQAVLAFTADWLDDWKVSETPEGIEASAYSGLHPTTARFRIDPAPGGARVTVEMQVQRASGRGYMLVDIGGFYDGKMRKWLQALPWWIHQKQAAASQSEGQPTLAVPDKPPKPHPSAASNLMVGCLVITFLLAVLAFLISAIVGLLTGSLYLPSNSGGETIHGSWARIASALILLLFGWIAFRIWKMINRNRDSGSQPPR
jgi:hypothetical protein